VDAIIVVADGNRIRQVVTNYLNNAHKFSEETRPIEVTLTTNAQEATVSVRDEGPGIPPAEQSHVWDQFYRAPGIGHVSGSSEGFGLGLYICMSIIQRHGGKLGVESALGQGSTFWFALPLANAPAAHPPSPAEQGDSTLTADSVQRKAASQEP
jgi:signal transduction histidine kinase